MKFKIFLKLLFPITIISTSSFWIYSLGITKGFLLGRYIDTPDVLNLFNPIKLFENIHTWPMVWAVVITTTVVTLLLTLETSEFTRKNIALPIIIIGLLSLFPVMESADGPRGFGTILWFTLTNFTMLYILPAYIVSYISKFLYTKGINIYLFLIVLVTIAVPIYGYSYNNKINTCDYGTNKTCATRKELRNLSEETCKKPGLKDFEINECYGLIASQTKDRNLCLNITNDQNSFYGAIGRCVSATNYNTQANEKLFKYLGGFLSSCDYLGADVCQYEKSALDNQKLTFAYKMCFQNTNESAVVECLKKQQFNYFGSILIKVLNQALVK